MAAAGGSSDKTAEEASFESFMDEVRKIEKRDAVLTSAQQINRLLRPGSSYANLNPYEVLMIDPDTPPDQIRKAYRKLSFLVHPDKNDSDRDRAQTAFEAVNKAYKMLDEADQLEYCKGIYEEAKSTVDKRLKEKRKSAPDKKIEEDRYPEKYKKLLHNTMTKLFADYEIKRRQLEEREANERKRQKELEEEEQEKIKREKEYKEEWDKTRIERVDSWRSFQSKPKKKKLSGIKPPKLKQEKRTDRKT